MKLIYLKFLFLLLIVFFVCYGCENEATSLNIIEKINFSIQKENSKLSIEQLQSLRIQNVNDSVIAYWIDYQNCLFYIYNFVNNKKKTLELDGFSDICMQYRNTAIQNDYRFLTPDRFGFYFWNNNIFYDINISTKEFKTYKINDSLQKNGIFDIAPFSVPQFPFVFKDNKVYFTCIYPRLPLVDEKAVKKFYNSPNTFCLNLNRNFDYETFGDFPINYKAGNMYNHHYGYRCVNSLNQIILSYTANDSVFIYTSDGEFINKKAAKSKYSEELNPISINNKKNIAEFRKYALTNSFYQELIYDKYRNQYYRVFKKKASFLSPDGKVRKGNNIAWSLIVFNNEFKKINEIEFDPSKFSPHIIIPGKNGVFIGAPYEKWIENQFISLTLISFNS